MIGVIGLLIAILIVLLDIYLWLKSGKTLTDRVIDQVDKRRDKSAQIILPPTANQEALDKIFEKNDAEGKDTKLEDIL